MKKFMIFLLMVVLFLGTSQARGEAPHYLNANLPLRSWIAPTHSFSMDAVVVTISPSQPQSYCVSCPVNSKTFGVSYTGLATGETVTGNRWFVNGNPTDSVGTTFTAAAYNAGTYTISCEVYTTDGSHAYTYRSNAVLLTVTPEIAVNIVGPTHACQNDIVTLTAQLDGTNLSPVSYQWRRNGQYIVGATEASYSFNVANLPGLTDTLVYEFDVQINRNGCESMYSPVHYFSVATTPVVNVVADLFCESAATTTLTATAYTNGDQQPYKYKWFKVGSTDTAITYVNTYVVTGAANAVEYGVLPVYTDFSCNPITPGVVTLHTFESLTTETLKNIAVAAANENVCAGAQNVLSVTDENTAFGAATYAWYIDGQLINGVTGATYAANFDGVGAHAVRVVASYENYPCATKEAADTFNVEAAPTMLTITGNNVICSGSTTDLTANASGADAYVWNTGDNTATVTVGEGVYTVTATSANGCTAVSDPFTVTSFGANLQVAASAMSICAGDNVTLTASEEGWTGNVTYEWRKGTSVISTSNVAEVTPDATTTYTAYATDGTCEATADITITVNAALAAPAVTVAESPICAGEQINVTANVTGAVSYIWYMDGVEIPGENLANLTYNVVMPGTHHFAAKAVGTTGCISAISTSTADVTVVTAPTLLTVTGNNVVCADSTSKLTAHAEGTNISYKWSEGTEDAVAVVPAGVYAVTASTANGCAVVETFTVYEFGSQVQVTATPAIVCAGESVVLNAQEDRYVGNVNYEWSNGAHANMTTVTPTESAWYKVTSSMGSCSRVDSVYVTVNPAPVVTALAVVEDTVCAGTQFTLTATAADAVSFVWFENGMEIAGNNMSVITLDKPAGVWSYNVVAVNAEGCRSELYATPAKVTVLANPSVQITGDPFICNDSTITLYANINDTLNTLAQGADYNYEWRAYNYTVATGTTGSLVDYATFTTTGPQLTTNLHAREYPYIFTAQTTNANGCVATSAEYYVYVGDSINVSVTLDNDTICQGGLVTATAHLGDYNMEHLVYQWYEIYDGEEHLIPSGTSPVYSSYVTHNPTTFKVKVTNTYTGCVAYGDSTAHIFTPVVKAVVLTTNGQSDQDVYVCEGATIEVVAYLEDESGNQYVDTNLRYVWKENGFLKPLVTGPYFQKQVGIYDEDSTSYTFECWIDFGVEGCAATQVASNTVHVRRNPIVVIEGNHNVCYFDNATPNVYLTAWVDGIADLEPTYTWYEHGHLRNNSAGFDNNYVEMWRPNYDNPYSFTVEVSYGNGCSRISDPFEVNVYNKPVVNITADETAICQGGEVELHANLDNYNDPMLTYQWYTNRVHQNYLIGGATHEVETFAPEADVNYIVRVIHLLYNDVYNANTQTCVAYDTIHISVNADPVIASVTNDLPESKVLCDGRSVTFHATTNGGVTGGEVYTWYRNGEVIAGANGATLTETPHAISDYPTTYVYEVSVKQTASGCESTVYVADTLTVNPNPTVAIATDPIVCTDVDTNIVMIANINPAPTTDYTFNWFEDNAAIAGATIQGAHNEIVKLHKAYRDYAYNFSVSLVNEYGCTAEAATSIYVNNHPVVNIASTDTTLCVGGEITLTANLNDWNADQLEFHWYDNGTIIPTATTTSYTVVPALGNHTYTFTVDQLTSLCQATSNVVNVKVVADPVIESITNDLTGVTSLCDGRSVTMTAHVQGGLTGGEVFTWYRNGEIIAGAVEATYTETPHAENNYPTTYSYTVSVKQAGEGCESNVFATPMVITVNPNPTLAIETDPIVCTSADDNIVLRANVNPAPTTNYTFNWFEDNAAIAGATFSGDHNEVATLTKAYRDYAYNFSVSLVNEYGCTATAETQVYVNDVPVVNITATETNICEGGEITLTANLNDYNADQLVYHWYDNGNMIANATELTYTVVPALGEHAYTFSVDQLTSLCHATSNTVNVKVNPDPVIASVTLSDYTVCQGAQIAVTATPEDGNKIGDVYTWYRNGILMEGATAATIYDSPVTVDNNTQHFVYTAVLTRPEAGCQSLPVSAAALTVYPNPTVVITGDQHVCETDSIFLIANVDTIGSAVGTLHYTWYESGMIRNNMAYNLGDNRFYAEYWYARTEPYRFTVNVEREGVPAGCASMSAEYLVYVYPRPVVNVTATETEICENGQVTLTANLVDQNAENMVYQWYEVRTRVDSFATGFDALGNYVYTYTNVDYHHFIPGANSVTYTTSLTTTTTLGVEVYQTNSQCHNSDEITITVNPLPVVTGITVNNQTIDTVCNGAQVNLAATITPADAQGAVYTWFRNGIEIPGANQSTFSENVYTNDNQVTTNVYTAIVTLPASGCQSLMSAVHADVIVNPAPSTVTVTGNNIICENSTTTLTVYSDVEGTITWSTGSHASSIEVPAGSYNVTVVTPEGCEMTSENFNVTALGTDLFVTASETSICQGEHTTLYANQDGWQGNVSYKWDAQANNSTSTTVDVQPEATTTYTVTATVNSTNGSCTAVGNVTIVVNPLPAQLQINTPAGVICQNDQYTLVANDTTADGYIWYQNGVEIPGENLYYLTVNFPDYGNYDFAVKAISDQGCVSALASAPVRVTVKPAPTTATITGNNVICENDSTVLTAHSDVAGTFTWNDGTVGATNTVVAGTYNVTITTAEGCHLTSDNFTVTAFGSDIQVTASETAICQGEHTTLYANEEGWQGNVTYLWSTGSTANSIDVTPEVTTTYFVTTTVSSTNGTCSQVGQITIVVTPRPARVNVTASAADVCEGDQVTFTADGDAYGYIWYQNGVEIPGENQAILTVNFPVEGAYSFQAKAINDQNCESELASAPVTVNVYSAPEQVVVSGNLTICGNNGSTTLYANVTPNVAGASYQWYHNNVAIVGANAASYTTTVAGSYKVDVTTHNCTTTSDAVNVFVEQAPQLQLTATENTICQNGTTVITAEATGWNNANVNYNWNTGFQGTSYTFTPVAAGDYTFVVTASQATSGCVATDEITIHVNAAPGAPVLTVNNPIICEGAQVTLTLTDTNTVDYGTPTISWMNNGIQIAGDLNAITLQPAVGVNTYNAVVTYPFSGCNTAVSAPIAVTVMPVPNVAIQVQGNTTLCDNGTTTLIANVTPANVTYNYTWLRDNVEIAGENAQALTVTLPARETAYNYTVIVSSYPGCVQTAEQAITVVPDPVVVANVSNNIICEGGNATFTAEVTNAGVPAMNGLYTYAWYNNLSNDTDAPLATTPSYTVSNAVAGNYAYRVVVTSPYGCETTSNIVNFSVVADPQVAVVVTPGFDATICEGGSTQLIANVTGGYGEPSYQWLVNGVVIPGATDRTYNVANVDLANNNIYNVVVRQSGVDCIAQSNNTVNPFTVVEHYAPYITGNANVCEGGFVTLTANVPNAIAGDAVTYEWHMNGQTVGTSNTYTTDPLTYGGTYFYDVTVHSAISGCSYTADAVQANVAQAPQVSILGGDINGNFTICENGQLVLNASVDTTAGQYVSGAPFTYTWRWFGAASGTATTATPQFTFPALAANDALSNPYFVEVSISRNDNSGCASTSEAHQVNINAVPSVNITANRAYVCEGGDVTFTANVAPVNAAYDYEWYVNGVRVMSNTQSITRTLNTVGNVNVMVIVSSANSAASCDDTATLVVPVHVVADPVVTITANHTAMCAGGSTTLSVANINVNNNIASDYTYQWAINGTEVPGAVASTFVQQLNTPGTYNYTLRVSQNENLGCVSQWSAPVTVLVAEQPEVTLTSINGLDICEGGSITMTATVNNYSNTNNGALNSSIYGPMTYTWMANGNNVQVNANVNNGSNQITETLNTVGNYNYIVYVTPSGYNCQPVASNINTVHVLNNPTWTDIVVRYPEMCFGETVELSANIVGGTADFSGNTAGSIQWMVSHNGVNSQVSGGIGGNSFDIPAAAGSYVYYPTFVGNMGSGCHLADSAAVQQHVTVYATPTAHFLGNDTICANDADQAGLLTIAFTGGAPYSFDIENMLTGEILPFHASATDTFSFYVQPNVTTSYRLTMLASGHGCSNDNIGSETMATVYVNSVDFAQTLFAASCDDNTMTINFNVISSYTDQYSIVENGTVIAQGTIVNNTATFPVPTEPGDHFVQFVIGGCTYDIVLRVPVTGFDGATAPLMDIRWDDVVIINTNPETNGGHTFVAFQWYRNGELIPGATYKNYQEVGGLNGYYSVELTEIDANGNLVTYVTCEQAFASLAAVKVYPVPAKVQQEITLELDLTAEELEGATLDIYNALGAQVSHMTNLKPINKIAGFTAQGTYFGRIITGTNDVKTVKFVIVK